MDYRLDPKRLGCGILKIELRTERQSRIGILLECPLIAQGSSKLALKLSTLLVSVVGMEGKVPMKRQAQSTNFKCNDCFTSVAFMIPKWNEPSFFRVSLSFPKETAALQVQNVASSHCFASPAFGCGASARGPGV